MLQKSSISKKCCSFELSVHQRILKKMTRFPQKYWHTTSSLVIKKFLQKISVICEGYVTFKTVVMADKFIFTITVINYILKYIKL